MTRTQFCPYCETDRPCARRSVAKTYRIQGHELAVKIPHWACPVCGTTFVDAKTDATHLVYERLREQEGLLQPDEIRRLRQRCGLSQDSFAALLGMSPATISRYERGALQDRPHDHLLRACEDDAFMLRLLDRCGRVLKPDQLMRSRAMLRAGKSQRKKEGRARMM